MDCIFCKIIKGDIPSYKIHENDKFYSFLSIGPHHEGHTLVIPKTHVDDFFDMDEALLKEILLYSKPLADALERAFKPKTGRVGVVVAGLEIPHAHLHLIPMDQVSDLYFSSAKSASPEELQQTLDKIKTALKS
ncbi:MAG: HIT family protein [Patescibacteria group bacterium]